MMTPFKKLWSDGGYGADNKIEDSFAYVRKYAKERSTLPADLTDKLIDVAIAEIMGEVENGRQFSTTKCPCGCEIDKSGTAITHAMLSRVNIYVAAGKDAQAKCSEIMINSWVVGYLKAKNPSLLERFKKWLFATNED